MTDPQPAPTPADPRQAWYWPFLAKLVALLAAAVVGAITHKETTPPKTVEKTVTVEKVIHVPAPDAQPKSPDHGEGWVIDPDAVQAVHDTLPARAYRDTPAGQVPATDLPKSVYGWKAYEGLFGQPPPIKNQGGVGSCVSFGTNTAIERTLAAEITHRKGGRAEWSRFVEEATYGGSRVQIGKGQLGNQDGSVGAWAAQFVTTYGMVPRKKYDSADLSTYSESRCKQWGSAGVPAAFQTVSKTFPVKQFVRVATWTEAKSAIAQGYMIAVCSNQGFSMRRDANGVATTSGSWAHCMCIDGYHTDDAGREFGHIVNSWGPSAHTGPVGPGNPNGDGFYAASATVNAMLRQGDSHAFSGVTGFPARNIDWFIYHNLPRPRDRLKVRPFDPDLLALAF